MDYTRHVNPRGASKVTPQSKKIPGSKQVKNSAGGYSFKVSDWDRLDRFLVLGTEGGSYYVGERKLTKDNAKNIQKLINKDGVKVVNRVVEMSQEGRAPKNDTALFVLAMASAAESEETRAAALAALPQVARIGTHLFHYAQYVEAFRGWGRALRRAVGNWYNQKDFDQLLYQVVKYKQRDGWSHRDLLRLAHPKAPTNEHNILYSWIADPNSIDFGDDEKFARLRAAIQLGTETDVKTAINLIEEFNLPREVLNTGLLKSKKIWEALLQKMPATAMLRNLGKMSSLGLLSPMSDASKLVISNLTNLDILKRARIHPLAVLVAMNTYASGHGVKGSLTWSADQNIVDALDEAFYLAFQSIESTGKRYMLSIDVSGSMWGQEIAGMPGVTPAVGAAAMAMVTARTEANRLITAFSSAGGRGWGRSSQSLRGIQAMNVSPKMRLDTVQKEFRKVDWGGTDCALPMLYAAKNKIPVDAFIVYTDSETWAGSIQPPQALQQYRDKMGIPAKLIVAGMVANPFTIADPNDAGMLDVVGFDTAAPNVMANFVRE